MNVDLFIPCFVDQLYPETGFNMVKILEKAGCTVHYNKEQTCCGQPAFNNGYRDEARSIGKKFLKDFSGSDNYVVCLSGSCTGYTRNYYQRIFNNTTEHNEVKKVNKRIFEFTEFLVDILKITDFGSVFPGKATYHDGCGSLRECGIKNAPRELLKNVERLELVEMKEAETCCGFGGTFALKFEPIATSMAHSKIKSSLETKAEYLISSDLSCLMHLEAYIKEQGLNLKCLHIADVLASGW